MIRTNTNGIESLEHLTPVQIAGLTQTSLKSVYRWIQAGKLKAEKAGNNWTVKRTDLETFLEARQATGGSTKDIIIKKKGRPDLLVIGINPEQLDEDAKESIYNCFDRYTAGDYGVNPNHDQDTGIYAKCLLGPILITIIERKGEKRPVVATTDFLIRRQLKQL